MKKLKNKRGKIENMVLVITLILLILKLLEIINLDWTFILIPISLYLLFFCIVLIIIIILLGGIK